MVSVCNGLDYRVYQYELGNTVELSAYTMINDLYTVEKRDTETMYGTLSGLCRHTHFSGTVTSATGG